LIRGAGGWRPGKFGHNGSGFGRGCCEWGWALAPHHRRRLREARRYRSGTCSELLLARYVRDAEYKCCTARRDKYGSQGNYFDY